MNTYLDKLENTAIVDHRIQCWVLCRLNGYHVVRTTMEPQPGWFGSIHYRTRWYLAR